MLHKLLRKKVDADSDSNEQLKNIWQIESSFARRISFYDSIPQLSVCRQEPNCGRRCGRRWYDEAKGDAK